VGRDLGTLGVIQGTLGVIQGTLGGMQGTLVVIQGTLGGIQGNLLLIILRGCQYYQKARPKSEGETQLRDLSNETVKRNQQKRIMM
jgi:hypothetical protein